MKLLPLLKLEELLPVSKKNPKVLETFGLNFLNIDMVSNTNRLINSINHSSVLHYFNLKEQELLKKRNAQFRRMQNYLSNGGSKPLPLQWDKTYQALERKILWREWCEKQRDQFNQPQYWDHLRKNLVLNTHSDLPSGKIHQLQRKWFSQNRLSVHTPQALQEIIQVQLPVLEKYYDSARRELHRYQFKMPTSHYQALDAALNKFQGHAARLKQQAASSCLIRLQIWDHTRGQRSNPIVGVLQEMPTLGNPSKSRHSNGEIQENISSKDIQFFIETIRQHGTSEEQAQLQTVSGLKTGSWCPLSVVQTAVSTQLVPFQVSRYIPRQKSWPSWLFRENHWLQRFFEDKTAELIQLNQRTSFVTWEISPLKLPAIDQLLQEWQQKDKLLKRWQEEGATQTASLFQFRKKEFLRSWQTVLTDYAILHLQEHVILAEKIHHFLQTSIKLDETSKKDFQMRLNVLIQKIGNSSLLMTNPSLQFRYLDLLKQKHDQAEQKEEIKVVSHHPVKIKKLFLSYLHQLMQISSMPEKDNLEMRLKVFEDTLLQAAASFQFGDKSIPELVKYFQQLRHAGSYSLLRVEARTWRRIFIQHQLDQRFEKDLKICEEQLQYFEENQRLGEANILKNLSTYAKSLCEQLKNPSHDHLEIHRALAAKAKASINLLKSNTTFFGKTHSRHHVLFTKVDRLGPQEDAQPHKIPLHLAH